MNSISYPTGAVYTFTKRDTTDNFGTDGIRKYQTYYMATLRNEYFNDETNKLSRFNVSQETIVHDNSIKEDSFNNSIRLSVLQKCIRNTL